MHTGFPAQLETPRCHITRFGLEDCGPAAALFRSGLVRQYLGGPLPAEAAAARARQYLDSEERCWAVRLRAGAFAGLVMVGAYHISAELELSYLFLPAFWGQGLAQEAIGALLEAWREKDGTVRLVAETQTANRRSCNLLKRLGFSLREQLVRFGAAQSVYAYVYVGDGEPSSTFLCRKPQV